MPKKPDETPPPEDDKPSVAEHDHGPHEHEDKPHKHDDHMTRAEWEAYKKDQEAKGSKKPELEKPTPALIDKPPPEVTKQEKKERVGRGLIW